MNDILQKLIDTAPLYQQILQQDIAFSISDMEKYLYMLETDLLKFPFPVGTRIDEGGYETVLNMIKSTGKPFINYVPREITGTVPLKAIVAPIYDGNEMVGLFSVSISMDKEEKVSTTSEKLTESVEQVYGLIDTITNSADGLNNMMQSIQENVTLAAESIKVGNESIAHIKKNRQAIRLTRTECSNCIRQIRRRRQSFFRCCQRDAKTGSRQYRHLGTGCTVLERH